MGGGIHPEIAGRYRRFARIEAAGRSPLYEAMADAIAGDAAMLAFVASLPPERQQPNLLLAAVRHLFGTQPDPAQFRATLLEPADRVRALMLARTTQTSEPARCAVLLPVLAQLPQPLALIEVGAAAGYACCPTITRMIAAVPGSAPMTRRGCAVMSARPRRCRAPCRVSSGARGWISTRWTPPMPGTRRGCGIWSGRNRKGGCVI